MDFYIINLFHVRACALCKYILDFGYTVYGIGERPLEELNTQEEESWMEFGRNANLIYMDVSSFLKNIPDSDVFNVFYFPFSCEIKNDLFLVWSAKYEHVIHYVKNHPEKELKEQYPKMNFLDDDEENLKNFFVENLQIFKKEG